MCAMSENLHGESVPMNQLVVDTDILILHLRGSKPVRDMLKEVAKTSLLSCSAITYWRNLCWYER